MDFDLNVLTTRELDELGKRIHEDGKFGADYAPMKKHEKIAFIHAEAVRLYGNTDGTAVLIENAKGVLAARDENGEEFEDADNASDCNAGANSKEVKPEGEKKAPEPDNAGGFGFHAGNGEQAGGENRCPDPNCRDDAECSNFEHKGTCPECDVPFANVGITTNTDDGELCPIEEKLIAFHGEGTGNGEEPVQENPAAPANPIWGNGFGHVHSRGDARRARPDVPGSRQSLWPCRNRGAWGDGHREEYRGTRTETDAIFAKETKRRKIITAPNLTFTFPNCPPISLDGKHPVIFPQVMALMSLADGVRQPVLLYGDAGGGKSHGGRTGGRRLRVFP